METNLIEQKLLEVLQHWKETHPQLSAEELKENYRCMIDIIDLIEVFTDKPKAGLKISMRLTLDDFNQTILKDALK